MKHGWAWRSLDFLTQRGYVKKTGGACNTTGWRGKPPPWVTTQVFEAPTRMESSRWGFCIYSSIIMGQGASRHGI